MLASHRARTNLTIAPFSIKIQRFHSKPGIIIKILYSIDRNSSAEVMGRKKQKMRIIGTGPKATSQAKVNVIHYLAKRGHKVGEIHRRVCETEGPIGYSTVRRILDDRKKGLVHLETPVKQLPTRPRTVRTPELIKKVNRRCNPNQANPPPQRQLAQQLHVSQSTIRSILNDDLGLRCRKKRQAFRLTQRHERIRNSKLAVTSVAERWMLGQNDVDRWMRIMVLSSKTSEISMTIRI